MSQHKIFIETAISKAAQILVLTMIKLEEKFCIQMNKESKAELETETHIWTVTINKKAK